MGIPANSDLIALITAPVVTAIVTWWLANRSKNSDARLQTESQLLGLGPIIIQGQNKRIGELEAQISSMWAEIGLARSEVASARASERNCLQRVMLLEHRLGITHEEE
jgi:hypothetical protein